MKKTFSRALSLLLVLVMVMGVMPVALADSGCSVSLTTDKSVYTAGETITLMADATPGAGYALASLTSPEGTFVNGVLTVTATESRTYAVTAYFINEDGDEVYKNNMVSVTVVPSATASSLILSIDKSVIYGGNDLANLTLNTLPAGASLPSDVEYIYDSSVISITNGVVKGQKVGTSTIVAKAGNLTSNAVSVEVKYTKVNLTGGKSALSLIVGEVGEMGVYASPSTTDATISYTSSNKTVATVDSTGAIVAKSKGTATITATLTLNRNSSYELGTSTVSTVVTVEEGGYIDCDAVNTTDTYAVVTPALVYNGYNVSGATFRYAASSNLNVTTSDYKTFYVALNGTTNTSTGTITFYANDFYAPYTSTLVSGNEIGSKSVTVSFYNGSSALKVVLADNVNSFYFNEEGIAQSATIGYTNVYNINNYSMYELIGQAIDVSTTATIAYWDFDVTSTSGGYLSYGTSTTDLKVPYAQIGSVRFIQKSTTNKTTTFMVSALSSTGSVLGQMYVTISAGEGISGIQYSTSASKAVTFNAADFAKYWNTMSTSTSTYGNLSYVTFGTPSSGTLYTNSSRTTKATSAMKFYYSTVNNNYNNNTSSYSLSTVTYMPTTSTAQYTVEIPFYAYGSTGKSITGAVVVKVNEQSNTIGARGVSLSSMADSIAENYYLATRQSLGFVVFELPSAQYATLYRSIPSTSGYNRVADAVRAQTGDRFYYGGNYSYNNSYNNGYYNNNYNNNYYTGNTNSPLYGYINNNNNGNYNYNYNTYSTTQYPLDAATLVPAAGYSGKITLNYTAYTSSGSNGYTGYITLDVQSLTASKVFSDVTVSNYSWAADSVDFLYYEGVAQGSNGKYNPKANITRGDFMLMLYRAFLADDYGTHNVTTNFSDVKSGNDSYSQEIYKAVGVAKYLGIAQGTDGKYNPKANITREEAMVLIYRTLNEINRSLRYRSGVSASSFTDYKNVSSWATTAIADLVGNGVVTGSNNKINPKANITRAEMACILHRVITY